MIYLKNFEDFNNIFENIKQNEKLYFNDYLNEDMIYNKNIELTPFEQYLNTIHYIKTSDTRYNDDDERTETRSYRVEFNNHWIRSDNSDPIIFYYTDIIKAIENITVYEDAPWNNSFKPMKIMYLEFCEVWLDENDFEVEESKNRIRYSDIPYEIFDDMHYFESIRKKAKSLLDQNYLRMFEDGELYVEIFPANEETAEELLQEVECDIHKYITKIDDWDIYIPSSGKYRTVFFTNDDKEFSATLRIADHTYNPLNNSISEREGYFVSIEIANKNPTSSRFFTRWSLRFNGENNLQDVVDELKNRFTQMIENYS